MFALGLLKMKLHKHTFFADIKPFLTDETVYDGSRIFRDVK